MFIMPSFKKSLIVEQFQGNYLKCQIEFQSYTELKMVQFIGLGWIEHSKTVGSGWYIIRAPQVIGLSVVQFGRLS